MPKNKSEIERATGKLISAIQKEWGDEIGTSTDEFSLDVMGRAHDILQCRSKEKIRELIYPLTVSQYLGEVWVQAHPSVKPYITNLELLLDINSS